LYMKAECYYQIGNFEMALVYYHRGHNLRPEVEEFSLGIKKASEAIENSVGESGVEILNTVTACLRYLTERADFWLQHKPIYARERERKMFMRGRNDSCKEKDLDLIISNKISKLTKRDNFKKNSLEFEKSKYQQVQKSAEDLLSFVDSYPRESIKDKTNTFSAIYNLIASSAFELRNYDCAEENYTQMLKWLENSLTKLLKLDRKKESETVIQEIWAIHESSRCHYELGNFQEAENFAKKSFELAKSIYNGEWMLNSAVILGKISGIFTLSVNLEKNDNYRDALEYYESAFNLSNALNDSTGAKLISEAIKTLQDARLEIKIDHTDQHNPIDPQNNKEEVENEDN
ncbi:tetratricopeptide repeat protein 25-like, partial [Octopus sinensis]|uniref:Outer dynein arm-docking complex subunit 4 n=1 Tax=Octopus sinensis TaxID=2607531 RepID=A0A6P7U488_9MOLL